MAISINPAIAASAQGGVQGVKLANQSTERLGQAIIGLVQDVRAVQAQGVEQSLSAPPAESGRGQNLDTTA